MRLLPLSIKRAISASTVTTTTTGSAIDLSGLENPGGHNLLAVLDVPTIAGTTPNLNVKIQESATTASTSFTDITGAAFTAVTTSGSVPVTLTFKTIQRYVRAVATFDANTTSATLHVDIIGSNRIT